MKNTATANRALPFARPVMLVLCLVGGIANPAQAASTWHVQADAASGGDGTANRPLNTLASVEKISAPDDTILIVPSRQPLEGGIQLKDGQRLIGMGDPVTKAAADSARPTISNTSARYDGDAIRLAKNNLVQNIHVDRAGRAGVFGVNAVGAQIRGNLVTNNLINGNDLRDLEARFILFQSQGNHFAGITLLSCGPAESSYCVTHAPTTPAVSNVDRIVIADNVIRDSNLEGILLLTDTGVVAHFSVTDNLVRDLSLNLPKPESLTPPLGNVRSRAFTLIALNASNVTVEMSRFHAENFAPPGNYAADGVVLLTAGRGPIVNARVSDLTVLNPRFAGEAGNGDSVEIQHRGTSDGVLNVEMVRAELRDPASANIKILESQNPSNSTYNVSIVDSVLGNANPTGGLDAQIRFSGASTGAKALNLIVKNTTISGIGGGIGVANASNLDALTLLVENSSFSDLTTPAGMEPVPAIAVSHPGDRTLGRAVIDLGGGSLGSRGQNRFAGKNPVDVSVTNSNSQTPSVQVNASNNYWGGRAPEMKSEVVVSGNVTFDAGSHLTTDPVR